MGAVISRAHAGYTGTGFVDYQHAVGDAVQWSVTAPAAAWYEFTFRYANGSTRARAMGLWVNGELAVPALSFGPTGSWSSWRTVTVAAPLAAGANAARLEAVGSSGPNVDSLSARPLA